MLDPRFLPIYFSLPFLTVKFFITPGNHIKITFVFSNRRQIENH